MLVSEDSETRCAFTTEADYVALADAIKEAILTR